MGFELKEVGEDLTTFLKFVGWMGAEEFTLGF